MSTDSPLNPVRFTGQCSNCKQDITLQRPPTKEYDNMNGGLWFRCRCEQITYLEKE